MFDIGGPELFFLLILALLIFGPRRLPQIGKQLGGFVAQMRHAMRDMQGTLEREVALEDVKGAIGEVKGIQRDATSIARELAGFGPPPYVDPNRRRDLPPGAPPDGASPGTADGDPGAPAVPDAPPAGAAGSEPGAPGPAAPDPAVPGAPGPAGTP
ncbi:MAG: twin-arginine translocase TatA/TatE family subunit [Acidobacteria bacterium]|jgi:Tat protein translocase TatB subunit|nr:twin-arginine translocase TatA/TatE family subunit [Acidobacteriota bacterium]